MSGGEMLEVRCRSCGVPFWVERPTRGPLASSCSKACSQRAYRERVRLELATEVADLALSSSHGRLVDALRRLGTSRLTDVRAVLHSATWNGSTDVELCSGTTTGPGGVVAPLHKEL